MEDKNKLEMDAQQDFSGATAEAATAEAATAEAATAEAATAEAATAETATAETVDTTLFELNALEKDLDAKLLERQAETGKEQDASVVAGIDNGQVSADAGVLGVSQNKVAFPEDAYELSDGSKSQAITKKKYSLSQLIGVGMLVALVVVVCAWMFYTVNSRGSALPDSSGTTTTDGTETAGVMGAADTNSELYEAVQNTDPEVPGEVLSELESGGEGQTIGDVASLPLMEAPEMTGYKAVLEDGTELVMTKEQVQARLDRDLQSVQDALGLEDAEFDERMSQLQVFDSYEASELTLFTKDSLEYFQFEMYLDYLIDLYQVKPTKDQQDEVLATYLESFAELEAEGYTLDELFLLEFGLPYDEWVATELEKTVARELIVDYLPITEAEIEAEAKVGYDTIGDIVTVKHILVDNQERAEAIFNEVQGGADLEGFTSETLDTGNFMYEFSKGEMVKAFEDWAFASKEGDLGVVETEYGFHVIQSLGVTSGVSELHKERAKQLLIDNFIYDGFTALNWEPLL